MAYHHPNTIRAYAHGLRELRNISGVTSAAITFPRSGYTGTIDGDQITVLYLAPWDRRRKHGVIVYSAPFNFPLPPAAA